MGLTSRDVMEKALEDLVLWVYANAQWGCTPMEVIYAQAELSKPEPDPVAWMRPSEEGYDSAFRDNSTVVECTGNKCEGWFPLYRKEYL